MEREAKRVCIVGAVIQGRVTLVEQAKSTFREWLRVSVMEHETCNVYRVDVFDAPDIVAGQELSIIVEPKRVTVCTH